ncbi:alpha-tocopherol transfer protein-like [Frankliniella occidentalis]|uniref:Alpha-tocopherol transfer protein-like n=1 Tax=Frankliniella occidentalis TaxID=133901 RepID=A0A6J1T0C1_FRAOC|nr:alpha-tocopherol transfer protein-like [Frankliniella occidentalis]
MAAQDSDDGDLPPWTADAFDVERELRVNDRLRREDLDEIQEWARRQRNLPAMREGDFAKFLHSCDYDVLAAETCINYYYKTRVSTAVFHNRDLSLASVKAQTDLLDFIVSPRLTPDGCRVVINALKDPDPGTFEFDDYQKVFLMMLDALLLAEPTLPGVYIVYDMHLGSIAHFWKFGFLSQRRLFAYFQSGLPIVLKGIILLHTPSYITTVMKVLRNFGDKKRLDETKMLTGDDYSDLHTIIPKECLPREYGGTLSTRAELHEMTLRRLDRLRDVFAEEEESLKKK